jgi:Mg2+/Co2+ transporter CorC
MLESGYKISAIEQTTDEIMAALHNKPPINSSDAELISSFLISCDLVKFAKYIPSKSEQETAVKNALEILEQAKKQSAAGSGQPAVVGGKTEAVG